jgi:hypothetical protein
MTQPESLMAARVDFAWRCHVAQESWTSKVDMKASVLLTVNLVGLAALLAGQTSPESPLATLPGWARLGLAAGTVLVGLAAVANVLVIFPILGRRRSSLRDTIYFGHLRERSPDSVAEQLAGLTVDDQIEQLARQLVAMARANWIKHRTLQLALLLFMAGYAVAGLSLLG